MAPGVCLRVFVPRSRRRRSSFARSPTTTPVVESSLAGATDPDPRTSAARGALRFTDPSRAGNSAGRFDDACVDSGRRGGRARASRRARSRGGSLERHSAPRARRSLRRPNAPFAPRRRPCAPRARSTSSSPARARPSPAPSPSRTCSRRLWTPASSSPTWGRKSLSRSARTSPPSSRPSGCPACPVSSDASTPRSSPSRARA